MERVGCNLCGSLRLRTVYEKPDELYPSSELFRVVECRDCGLGFVDPRPTVQEMSRYYPGSYYEDFRIQQAYHRTRYAREAQYLARLSKKHRSPVLLDVGCANGDFPRFMKERGWLVEGVEVSVDSEPITDFPVYSVPFPDIPSGAPRYNAVTAWAVLEHVHDPKAYFLKAAEVLQPGGLFVFLVTNFRSLSSRSLFQEDVPRHLYFFTEPTVRRYLRLAGLDFERADYSNDIYSMRPENWLHYYTRSLIGVPWGWPPPDTYRKFVAAKGLARGWRSVLKFTLSSPLSVLDRLLLPVVERYQQLAGTYGIVTYVARKP